MNLVVDTNIVFSAILNTNSLIASILTEYSELLTFYSPAFLLSELDHHRSKLSKILQINDQAVLELQHLVVQNVHFVDESQISQWNWLEAQRITTNVDADDIAFVALSLELKCPLWTGDKQLHRKIANIDIFSTKQLVAYLKR